jgi:TonB family protein
VEGFSLALRRRFELVSFARSRRSSLLDQWRVVAIAAAAIAVHLAVLTFVEPPRSMALSSVVHDDEEPIEPVEGVGGTFVVSPDCMTEVFAGAMARLMSCYFPFVDDRSQCLADSYSWYRVETVGCSEPDSVQFAEYDATPLIDAETIDLAMLEANLEQLLEEAKERQAEDRLQGQVVDTPAPAVEKRPDEYEYLAEHDNTVEKETVKHGTPGGSVLPQPVTPKPEVDPHEAPEAQPPSLSKPGGGALSMRAPGTPGTPEQDDLPDGSSVGFDKMSLGGIGAMRGITQPLEAGPVGGGGENGTGEGEAADFSGTSPHNLRVTDDVMRQATGGTNDHLPGVEEGETTALNTRKWKYASFFNRVKRQVAQNWHPENAYRLRDPNGNIYGTKDRLTVLTVSLEPDGKLHKVMITGPSGVEFLDDEAIKAFELAEPFPNPPGGLIDGESKLITFRFGFSFEINNRSPWRIFRYNNR